MGAGTAAAAIEGLLLGAGLIIAIGAQNAFVLRQGLARRHVFAVTTVCALSDVLLIVAGIAGLGGLMREAPGLLLAITLAGAAFVAGYGVLALRRAARPGYLEAAPRAETGLAATIATCLALTWLNPHVYLDTVVLIGALSARYVGGEAVAFGAGASAASILWFYGLGFGARLGAPVFSRPQAWRVLDVAIGVVMLLIAARLIAEAVQPGL
jgi:L-lysine exporter family protein LysE/ArgO